MRVVLLGGLTTLLVGLVAFGAVLITDRRTKPVAPVDEEPDTFEPPPRRPLSRDRLPARRASPVSTAVCAPKPGRACWRGRLRLTEAVRKAWSEARAAKEAGDAQGEGDDGGEGDDEADATYGDAGGEITILPVGEIDEDVAAEEDADDDTDEDRTQQAAGPVAALPPEGSFVPFFRVRAVFRDDQPVIAGGESQDTEDTEDTGDTDEDDGDDVVARLAPDGTFELDVPPGRYDLEVISKDQFLIAGLDRLDARAGDARDGLDLVLAPPVAIVGRVFDDDGVAIDATVELRRVHSDEGLAIHQQSEGRFAFARLRPGPYLLTATSPNGPSQQIEVRAPLAGIALRVTRLPDALVLIGPASNGQCALGTVVLTSVGPPRERRSAMLRGCQGTIRNLRPGSTWRAVGKIDGRPFDRMIAFGGGKPVAPVCLDHGCRSDVAALEVRVVDADGTRSDAAEIEILAGPEAGRRVGTFLSSFTGGLRAGATLTLRTHVGPLEATASVWLAPGVNDAVIRLPGRFAERD